MQTPTIYVRQEMVLPDTDQWQFRFNIESESSDRLYIISQHKKKSIGDVAALVGERTGTASTCKH